MPTKAPGNGCRSISQTAYESIKCTLADKQAFFATFSMNLLVVDDEPDVQALFEQRFRREIRSGAMTFTFAHSAQEALDFLTREGSNNLLILSDINMPGMSGLELLKRIRAMYTLPPPPVIMMITAYGDQPSYQQAMQDGANDFLSKPLDFTELKAKIAQLAGS